jgi:hypothetical protein
MLLIPYLMIEDLMRRSLIGAHGTDPVVPERPRGTARGRRRAQPLPARSLQQLVVRPGASGDR